MQLVIKPPEMADRQAVLTFRRARTGKATSIIPLAV